MRGIKCRCGIKKLPHIFEQIWNLFEMCRYIKKVQDSDSDSMLNVVYQTMSLPNVSDDC